MHLRKHLEDKAFEDYTHSPITSFLILDFSRIRPLALEKKASSHLQGMVSMVLDWGQLFLTGVKQGNTWIRAH